MFDMADDSDDDDEVAEALHAQSNCYHFIISKARG